MYASTKCLPTPLPGNSIALYTAQQQSSLEVSVVLEYFANLCLYFKAKWVKEGAKWVK